MAHVSAINAPSDIYGAVADVSRPLIYKLNQASMQRSTHIALRALLVWALAELDGNLQESLDMHEARNSVPAAEVATIAEAPENELPETPAESLSAVAEGDSVTEVPKAPVASPSMTVADATPLTLESLGETPADAAAEAEVAAIEAESLAVVKTTRVAKPK